MSSPRRFSFCRDSWHCANCLFSLTSRHRADASSSSDFFCSRAVSVAAAQCSLGPRMSGENRFPTPRKSIFSIEIGCVHTVFPLCAFCVIQNCILACPGRDHASRRRLHAVRAVARPRAVAHQNRCRARSADQRCHARKHSARVLEFPGQCVAGQNRFLTPESMFPVKMRCVHTHVPQKTVDFGNKESVSVGRFRLGTVICTVPE